MFALITSLAALASVAMAQSVVPDANETVSWAEGTWLNPPESAQVDDDNNLVVVTKNSTDFWRLTSYGFIHDNGHALLVPFPQESAFEITYKSDFTAQFDQAGIMVRVDEKNWIKSGVEFSDGVPQLGAVVTQEFSDWSVAPSPDWTGVAITMRVSRSGNALTLRAKRENDNHWQLVRVAPLNENAVAKVGPFACSPTREGLEIKFTKFAKGSADTSLHPE